MAAFARAIGGELGRRHRGDRRAVNARCRKKISSPPMIGAMKPPSPLNAWAKFEPLQPRRRIAERADIGVGGGLEAAAPAAMTNRANRNMPKFSIGEAG